jgi:hypothetical protein
MRANTNFLLNYSKVKTLAQFKWLAVVNRLLSWEKLFNVYVIRKLIDFIINMLYFIWQWKHWTVALVWCTLQYSINRKSLSLMIDCLIAIIKSEFNTDTRAAFLSISLSDHYLYVFWLKPPHRRAQFPSLIASNSVHFRLTFQSPLDLLQNLINHNNY